MKTLSDLRPVYVVGVGWHPYRYATEEPYVTLGLTAVRQALADAGVEWPSMDAAFVGTALLGMASGRPMLRHLGATGLPLVHVENASASGSAAFRAACLEVACGLADTALALGIDKAIPRPRTSSGLGGLAEDAFVAFTHFALLTNEYAARNGVAPEDVALVAVKNHGNGALNPNAQRQKARTLDEVLGGKPISGTLTSLQCCPVGEGAASVIVCSEDAIQRLGIDPGRAIRVTASAVGSETPGAGNDADAALTRTVIGRALAQAQRKGTELDVLEVHDAFTIEELLYAEAAGLCGEGQAIHLLKEGAFHLGGQCAISPSGGLIAMGHPIGPTGVGQVGEVVTQLRGEAGARQHKGARIGMAHMVGLGSVAYAHVLERP
ncbi:MAG: thiolase family protein [Alphaproteobacteria bacterium]|nr:thiolase family protein [Alphaproteobacteria bacterium]MBU1515349.1 thiolase family protein [Alphaproteobacteria bacterium]MBU2095399.1 thiolase family protein [Alphaproteobacteria bacterium]MBU2152581.1 thiolase family protein [Alphaproteobacteria bacterium]MBU2309977.1 thiolase family protein [Alphaproteobacteria bacterium]